MSLNGLCILNTRPLYEKDRIAQAIQKAGGTLIAYPTIDIVPLDISTELLWLRNTLCTADGIIFTSPNAVAYAITALTHHHMTLPPTPTYMAVGKATTKALSAYHINTCETPLIAGSESLLQSPGLQHIQGKHFLIFTGVAGRELLIETLKHRGAHVHTCCVYQRQLPQKTPNIQWHQAHIDLILFTSETGIHNLFKLVDIKHHALLRAIPCLLVSNRLLEAAQVHGFKTPVMCRIETILKTLNDFRRQDASQ